MIAVPYTTVNNVIGVFNSEIVKFTAELVANLKRMRRDRRLRSEKIAYISKLILLSEKIITATPDTLLKYQKAFDKIISPKDMASKQFENFRNRLIKELGYTTRRSDFYPIYFHKIGIKSCVYCNAHLTVAIEKKEELKTKSITKYKAKFQVDHYWPKSKYPCFSISLYNLYPVCGNCNNCKSSHNLTFSLYCEPKTQIVSPFKFSLAAGSVAKYLLRRRIEDVKFTFHEPAVVYPSKNFQDVFDIHGIYETQKDLAEELILKAQIYSLPYRQKLKKQFSKLFTTPGIFNRILLGNYSSEADIHKRPMAKFTIDIARQVGLIKK